MIGKEVPGDKNRPLQPFAGRNLSKTVTPGRAFFRMPGPVFFIQSFLSLLTFIVYGPTFPMEIQYASTPPVAE